MAETIIVKKNAYHDSVTLMAISGKIAAMPGVAQAVVSMATDMNKELLQNVGLWTDTLTDASADDLVVAVRGETDALCQQAVALVEELLGKRKTDSASAKERRPASIHSAVQLAPETNLAVISVPGQFAAREARQALEQGLHVMMFSDNVTIEEEKELKQLAHARKLLMMGPDCGTAIINQVGLCFANSVRSGNIGIIGASGTGTQEVTVLIDRLGGGVSQAIGVGGRDLQEKIGGIMMLDSFAALQQDERTKVIVLISKPPAQQVAEKIFAAIAKCPKPVVVSFIHGSAQEAEKAGARFAPTLEAAARLAVALADGGESPALAEDRQPLLELAKSIRKKLKPEQKYVRGLFCGGTLCDEAIYVMKQKLGSVYSNIAKDPALKLSDVRHSRENTCIDLGDDAFTVGKPHPMIEPGLRLPRLLQEANDQEAAVLLLDVVLGFGSHPDPAGITAPVIREAKQLAAAQGRHLEVIAYVCGTDADKQNRAEQERKLVAAGAILAESNASAAYLAAAIIGQGVE